MDQIFSAADIGSAIQSALAPVFLLTAIAGLLNVLLVAAAPQPEHYVDDAQRQAFADRAGRVMGLAAETFNDGLRAYYFSFAATAWFFSPWAFMVGTLGVVWILYRREFHSEVLAVLRG